MKRLLPLLLAAFALAGCHGSSPIGAGSPGQHAYATPYGPSAHPPGFGAPPKTLMAPAPVRGVATLEMFDTVTLATVPANPLAVAGYTSGYWPTYSPLARAYPALLASGHVISINIRTGLHAHCLDIEPGDASPDQAAGWVRSDLAAGFRHPCLYANLSTMPAVRSNLTSNGITRSTVLLWDADWTYYQHLDAGYDCTQWTDHAYSRNLDESTCTTSFFGTTAPKPPPPRVHCYGPHAQRSAHCNVIRGRVSAWNRKLPLIRRGFGLFHCNASKAHATQAKPCPQLFAVGDELHADITRNVY